ncbi:MAG: hypothetical protein ACFCU4_00480 [Puniceicoccaceae bacterium]
MNSIKAKILIIFMVFACFSGCVTRNQCRDDPTVMKTALMNDFIQGMHVNEVVEMLDANEIEYSTYASEPRIRGVFRNVEGGTRLAQKNVLFYFYFDQNNRLFRKDSKDIFTGM